MFELKPLSIKGLKSAYEKAERYRLLNEPKLAESICLDILEADPNNKEVIIVLILSLTDQFGQLGSSKAIKQARELVNRLDDEYSRIYYMGIIHERQGTTALNSGIPGCEFDAFEWYREAMEFYEKAQEIHLSGNEDAVLRWNTCARIIMEKKLTSRPKDDSISMQE